jgi:ribosomal protein L37AE/L43A
MKEKFGTLRVYVIGGDDRVQTLIEFAEQMSAVTCEDCGAPGERRVSKGSWIKTRCNACDKEEKDKAGYGYGV